MPAAAKRPTASGPSKPHRPLRLESLRLRVERNRIRFAVFLVAFVTGSAVLLSLAFVAVPGSVIGLVADAPGYYAKLGIALVAAFGLLLLVGGIVAFAQVSNAEHWVRSRFNGAELDPAAHPALVRAVEEMAIAGGLPEPPALLLFNIRSVNACAIGAGRKRPIVGVTRGLLDSFTQDEQQAVVATLIARITRGDIMVGTALAALMGPLKYLRQIRKQAKAGAEIAEAGADAGCGDGCAWASFDGCGDLGDGDGCGGAIVIILFVALVAILTWVAITVAAWLVTIWGRALHRTGLEKADAEGMLLLRDPQPMLSALRKAISSSNQIADGDPSYDGIFYAPTSGTAAIEKVERRRYDRLREVLGIEGLAAAPLDEQQERPLDEHAGRTGR